MGRLKNRKKHRRIEVERKGDYNMYYVWYKSEHGLVQRCVGGIGAYGCNEYGGRTVPAVPQKTAEEKAELKKEMQRIFFAEKCSIHLTYEEALQSTKPMSAFPAGNGIGLVRKELIGGQNVVQIVEKTNAVPCLQDVPERIQCTIKKKLPYSILRELLAGFKAVYDRDSTEAAAQVYRKYVKYAFMTILSDGVHTVSFPNINLSVIVDGLEDKGERIRQAVASTVACEADAVVVDVDKKEVTVLGDFFVYYPKQENTAAHTSYSKDEAAVTALRKDNLLVMETHSHASMGAFFSGEDDRNELVPLMYCVFGQFNTQSATFKGRVKFNKLEQTFNLNDFFEIPIDVADPLSLTDLDAPDPVLLENATIETHGTWVAGNWNYYDEDYGYNDYWYRHIGYNYQQPAPTPPPTVSHIGKAHIEAVTLPQVNDLEWLVYSLTEKEAVEIVKMLRKKHGLKITLV